MLTSMGIVHTAMEQVRPAESVVMESKTATKRALLSYTLYDWRSKRSKAQPNAAVLQWFVSDQ